MSVLFIVGLLVDLVLGITARRIATHQLRRNIAAHLLSILLCHPHRFTTAAATVGHTAVPTRISKPTLVLIGGVIRTSTQPCLVV